VTEGDVDMGMTRTGSFDSMRQATALRVFKSWMMTMSKDMVFY